MEQNIASIVSLIPLIFLILVCVALFRRFSRLFNQYTVLEYQRGLLFREGKFDSVLEPGLYRMRLNKAYVQLVDTRFRIQTIPGQEILSQDGVSFKMSALIEYRVTDPVRAVLEYESYESTLYTLVQKELRLLVGETPIDQILEVRQTLGSQLTERVKVNADVLGIEVKEVSIKDIMFPGALKASFSQVARAKQEGLAALERARGESAALRNLANAAKLLESNPNLYKLRLLQTLNQLDGSNNPSSVVLHVDSDKSA